MTSRRMPSFFIPHGGGPCFFMDWTLMGGPVDTWDRTKAWLEGFAATLPERPRAIVVVSGHWETAGFTAGSGARPRLIYDYSGFPEHTYRLTWPAPGAPELAGRIAGMLRSAGLAGGLDPERGYDHGVFIPLKVAFPAADIPVVTLSLRGDLDPAAHIAAGAALAPLRDEGVLIVGSGMSYHNMRGFSTSAATAPSETFDAWLAKTVETADPDERTRRLDRWAEAPAARDAHPREEHLIPLMVAAGAGARDRGTRVFSDVAMMARLSAFRFG